MGGTLYGIFHEVTGQNWHMTALAFSYKKATFCLDVLLLEVSHEKNELVWALKR